MKFNELMMPWVNSSLPELEVLSIEQDSRQVKPGFLFFALPGQETDGRLFIPQAVNNGAKFIVYDPQYGSLENTFPSGVTVLPLPELSKKLAAIALRFYDYPSKKMDITGVTGTNGKTTIAYQLAQAHRFLRNKTAYIGTLGQGEADNLKPLANTTPGALCLQQLLANYSKESIKQVCMEVSSHALCQNRVEGIEFKQAIFTNLSHEHLDYHRTMEAYAQAKAQLFATPSLSWAILNRDDKYFSVMKKAIIAPSCHCISYGTHTTAEIKASDYEVDLTGSRCFITSPWGKSKIEIKALGKFNIYNALAIFSSLLAYGYSLSKVEDVLKKLAPAPGRMEIISQEPYVIVDYAHTPDALQNAILSLKKITKGRIIVVFGCGGNRDKTKRPIMGNIVSKYADIAIITSDNPRTEHPSSIMTEIEAGIERKKIYYKIEDREEAIIKALAIANKTDLILVAGKGHEQYQQIGTTCHPFSDQAIIKALLLKKSF